MGQVFGRLSHDDLDEVGGKEATVDAVALRKHLEETDELEDVRKGEENGGTAG